MFNEKVALVETRMCWAIIIHANFSEAKKVFCKKSPVSFREKTKTTRLLSSPLFLCNFPQTNTYKLQLHSAPKVEK